MAHTSPSPARQHVHRRRIEIDAWLRDDGFWDLEGSFSDVRDDDFAFVWGQRPGGTPIHDMQLTLTVDAGLVIREAKVRMSAVPYTGVCERIASRYAGLEGLHMGRGFRQKVRALFGDENGCTHLSNLIQSMASAAYQSVSRPPGRPAAISEHAIGGCHALARDGELVRRWTTGKAGT